MFTGIIEAIGVVKSVEHQSGNLRLRIDAPFGNELKVDQSISHNGACLTVTAVHGNEYEVMVIHETLARTNFGKLKAGDQLNLERSLLMNGRLDGHLVQGHVDETAACINIEILDGSHVYTFEYKSASGNITIEKGSICVNGVSLTVVRSEPSLFSVAIIPYTFEHTTFHSLKKGDIVNLEFDMIGKYVARLMNVRR
jgi:riboflavin synthase